MDLRTFVEKAKLDPPPVKWGQYLDTYTEILSELPENLSLLELGCLNGGSLNMWARYRPEGFIVGADKDYPSAGAPYPKNVQIVHGNLKDPDVMARVRLFGPFNLIIDDASHVFGDSHRWFHQLWPRLVPGGYYVVEDFAAGGFVGSILDPKREVKVPSWCNLNLGKLFLEELCVWGSKQCDRKPEETAFRRMIVEPNYIALRKRD